jgi:hypothetical protein
MTGTGTGLASVEEKILVSDAYRFSYMGCFACSATPYAECVSVELRIWAAAAVWHTHLHAPAQEQHWGDDGAPITRPVQLSPICSNGAPASRLNMQAE